MCGRLRLHDNKDVANLGVAARTAEKQYLNISRELQCY
jgi:hypothetical protein